MGEVIFSHPGGTTSVEALLEDLVAANAKAGAFMTGRLAEFPNHLEAS